MSDQSKRYVPPHLRGNASAQRPDRPDRPDKPPYHSYRPGQRTAQRSGQPFVQQRYDYSANEEFVATFKSSKSYEEADIPAALVEHVKPETGVNMHSYKFKVVFQHNKLRELMRWFRNTGRTDSQAVLEFPPTLSKEQRKEIHLMADNFVLGTSSQGFGDKRFISIYTAETAAHGDVGKISLTEEERRKSKQVWFLVRTKGGEYSKYSHNEIDEMLIAGQLDPVLQELLDKNQDLLASEFEAKCKVDETANNWRDECKY